MGLVSTKTLAYDINRWWQTAILRRECPYFKIGEANDRFKNKRPTAQYISEIM